MKFKPFANKTGSYIEKQNDVENDAVDIMYEQVLMEYQMERERSSTLDHKVEIWIGVLIAIGTIFIPIMPWNKIISIFRINVVLHIVLLVVFLIIFCLAWIFMIRAFLCFLEVLSLKAYRSVEIDNLNDQELQRKKDREVKCNFIDHYCTILKENSGINDEKADNIERGMYLAVFSFVLIGISTIGAQVVSGIVI